MGFLTVEYHIRNVIEEGIARLRDKPDELDVVFAELTTGSLGRSLGRRTLEKVKEFFVNNDIPVRNAFNPNQPEMPSVTVHLVSSIESQQYRRLQDHAGYTSESIRPAQLSDAFYAQSYNNETGLVTLPANITSDYALPGQPLFSVKDNVAYFISGQVLLRSPLTFNIVDSTGAIPARPNLSEVYFISKIDFANKRVGASVFEETFEVRTYAAANTDEAIWLYYIVQYILFRNKQYFESVGLESQTVSAGEFIRDLTKTPNNIWGRYVRLRFLVEHSWLE